MNASAEPHTLPDPERSLVLSRKIRALLANHPPGVQAATLAHLLSLWLAVYARPARPRLLARHMEIVSEMVPLAEAQMFPNGLPKEWRGNRS